jgi:hypothetical protein
MGLSSIEKEPWAFTSYIWMRAIAGWTAVAAAVECAQQIADLHTITIP